MRRVIPLGSATGLVGVVAVVGVGAVVGVVGLLAAQHAGGGLGLSGWVVGLGCGLGLAGVLTAALARAGRRTLLPADRVTLTRAVLTCGVAALTADAAIGPGLGETQVRVLVLMASVALVLDAVDGQVARRTGTVTALGARFDMETDAFLILVLSVHVSGDLGWWVLCVGAARYVLMLLRVVSRWAPWLRGEVPARRWRKAVAAYQGIALVVAAAQVLPRPAATTGVAVGLALLLVSFGTEIATLRLSRTSSPGRQPIRESSSRRRRLIGRTATAAAVLFVWVALVAPSPAPGWSASPASLLRIPVEGIVLVAAMLALRGTARRWVEVTVGVVLGLLLLVRILDAALLSTLYRPFNPITDWRYLGSAKDLVGDSAGPGTAALALTGLILLVALLVVGLPLAVRRVGRLVARHRAGSVRALAGASVAWLACAGLAVGPAGARVASTSTATLGLHEVTSVRDGLRDRDVFAAMIPADPFADGLGSTAGDLLTALRGKDVVIAFVESYGRVAVEQSPDVARALDSGAHTLAAAGFSSRSAWLTSPTFGGISWLAHSSFQSGLWVNSQQRYDQLISARRLTLTRAFSEAGWRTVDVIPANRHDWPEGKEFYGYDEVYDSRTLGYRGPGYGYAPMPDQFTLSAFRRLELAPQNRRPVMAEIDLVTSHIPWAPLPALVDWEAMGDGSLLLAQAGRATPRDVVWSSPDRVRTAYGQSVAYSLNSVMQFLEASHDDDLVVVLLGDHQPVSIVSGAAAGHDVPVSIIARDPAVLDRIESWHWQDGLRPGTSAPIWPMDHFRDRFLTAYGPSGAG